MSSPLSTNARAAIYGIAWLPFLVLVAIVVPKFEDSFGRLRERAELPALTEWLLLFVRLNQGLLFLPCVLVLLAILVADVGFAGLMRRSHRQSLYWVWFAAVVVLGIAAAAGVAFALLLPDLKGLGPIMTG
jgi:type II secretory pathway component PulF